MTATALPDELVAETLPAFHGGDFGVVAEDFAGEGFTPADLADFAREAGAAFAFLGRVEGELGCAAA